MGELEKGMKELREITAPWGEQQSHPASLSRASGDWITNQRVDMEGPIDLAAYVAEYGLVGHQWEKWPLDLRVFIAPV